MKTYPLYTALTQLDDFYDIELDDDTFENYAMSAYRKIGNKQVKLKVACLMPERDSDGGWSVCLPCDCDEIEAVCYPWEYGQTVSATDDFLGTKTIPIENWIEGFKFNRDKYYLPGMFVNYTLVGDKLYFVDVHGPIHILYKAQVTDEDGLPLCTESEIEAITSYCAYSYYIKRGRKQKDQSMIQIAQLEYANWLRLCSKARVAESLSQNDMNEILDTLTSFDVHQYGVSSTKPIK